MLYAMQWRSVAFAISALINLHSLTLKTQQQYTLSRTTAQRGLHLDNDLHMLGTRHKCNASSDDLS